MASAAAAIDQAAPPKPVEETLWWDSFVTLFEELDAAPLSSDLPDRLVEKLKNNHAWFLNSVSGFRPPSQVSKAALDSPQISIGSHRLSVKPELKAAALRIAACLCLDEVQSYILVDRSSVLKKSVADFEGQEFLHLIVLQYFLERQCLLKCVRRIFMHALYITNGSHSSDAIRGEALRLIHDGLDKKLLTISQDLLSSVSLDKKEVDFIILWVEETLIEDNLILDILFLCYYDNFCTCGSEQWKTVCSLFKELLSGSDNIGKLAASVEAKNSLSYAKAQLLLILIETLNLENLLRMVHDEVPFRQGNIVFSLSEIQELDAVVSSFSTLGLVEAGPLILAWATFLCLLLSLPKSKDYNLLSEIDHITHVRQAFELSPFNYVLEILHMDSLRDLDGPVSGFLSIWRTFISAFIASYEVNHQIEDNNQFLVLDTLCLIYHGEESLSTQFWDRESFVDGPIRSLLYMLESEFPFRTVKLLRLLSALSEGKWSSECVYNFLSKISGVTSLFEIPHGSRVNVHDTVVTQHQLYVLGIEGLYIPIGSRGSVLRIVDSNLALVRWEYKCSGVILLLLRVAQSSFSVNNEETCLALNLFCRMMSFSLAVTSALLNIERLFPAQVDQIGGVVDKNTRIDMVEIICSLILNLAHDVSNAVLVSICIKILALMLKCAPSHVIEVASRMNIFGTENTGTSSVLWLLSGGFARMLLADCVETGEDFSLTTSVLDFTLQLLETGAENDTAAALVVFSLQFILVNHVHWRYKYKYSCLELTLKVLELIKSCTKAMHVSVKFRHIVGDILLNDSSVHNIICCVLCNSAEDLENLSLSSHHELKEIECLHLAVCSALDIIFSLLADLSGENISSTPAFLRMLFSSTTKPFPVVTATVSLISSCHNPAIQVAAVRVLSMLCFVASKVQPYIFENVSFPSNYLQICYLRRTLCHIIDEEMDGNEDLIIAIIVLLVYAARYQPAFLVSILLPDEDMEVTSSSSGDKKEKLVVDAKSISSKTALEPVLKYLKKSDTVFKCSPCLLLGVLKLLRALWEGGGQYMHIVEKIRSSEMFWGNLSSSISAKEIMFTFSSENLKSDEIQLAAYGYQCQATVLEITAQEMFFLKKLLYHDMPEKKTNETSKESSQARTTTDNCEPSNIPNLKDILSIWCKSPTVENLIKSCSSIGNIKDIVFRAKMTVCLCAIHLMCKLLTSDGGCLSISLIEKIRAITKKLSEHPSFSALLAQYSFHGYNEGKDITSLVLNDLYYHLQGELEGREMSPGSFKELSNFLLEMEIFEFNDHKIKHDIMPDSKTVFLFDITCLRAEFQIELWGYSDFGASKEVAERMFLHMHDANSMMFLQESKHFVLEGVIANLSMYEQHMTEMKPELVSLMISKPVIVSSITRVCQCLQETVDSVISAQKAPQFLLRLLASQAELLLILSRILCNPNFEKPDQRELLPVFALLIKKSGFGIRSLADIRPPTAVLNKAMRVLLVLLITSMGFSQTKADMNHKSELETDLLSELSLSCLGLLPVLCKLTENIKFCDLAVASLDVILKHFLAPDTWLPVLQKHLHLQVVLQLIQHNHAQVSVSSILNFFLTLAHVRGGAKMLHFANFFSSLKVLFSHFLIYEAFSSNVDMSSHSTMANKDECKDIWSLGLGILASMICSLGDDSSCINIVDGVIHYFSEKAYLISGSLSSLKLPADDHGKKRARIQKAQTSLVALRETEHTLALICVLARYQASWSKGMQFVESDLRETAVHILAFISKVGQRPGDSPYKTSFYCPPSLKEEFDINGRPSFINVKSGWFKSTVSCLDKSEVFITMISGLAMMVKDQGNENANKFHQTQFSDMVAIQIYRIAFLLLKFLCMQAKAAAKRAEEVEFIDLARFPELPMPEILHGLQDQAIAIVTEIFETNKSKPMHSEAEGVCRLLLQILEKCLYLELCVSQSCGIRPVSGRVEDFSKEFKRLLQVAEPLPHFKAFLRSLSQMIALVYPGIL